MKNIYLFLIGSALLVPGSLLAQPTLTAANNAFVPGDVQVVTKYNASGTTSGASGANVTWNYALLTPRTDIGNNPEAHTFYEMVNPSQGATVYSINYYNNRETVNYYIVENTHMSFKGWYSTLGQAFPNVNYSDPRLIVPYPFTYADTVQDSFAYTFYAAGTTTSHNGNFTAIADAYGTLILPGGVTLANVLRVKTTNPEMYTWYKPGMHGPVFSWRSLSTPEAISYITTLTASPDVIEMGLAFNLFPNPAKGFVTIQSKSNQAGPLTAYLLNALGQEVRQQVFAQIGADNHFSLDNVPAGIYFFQLQIADRKVTRKLVVE